ncbi:DUF2780 domain-containing protein [Gilvimarinus sp. 1_MG-2023]|nr:DUF2780 domain-containing protein [Gilvimarinus sp. 1_MG-2023]
MKPLLIAFLSLFVALNAQAFDLGDVDKALGSNNESSLPTGLLSSLTDSLDISSEQAAGGTSALLAMAANNLSGDNASLLGDIIPTGSSGGLTSQLVNQITSMDGVQSAFEGLGMDPALIQQFTPIVMGYIGNNGGGDLLGMLGSLWGN